MPTRDFSKIAVDALTEKQAKAEHARLEAEIKKHDAALLPEGRADRVGRGIRRAAPPLRGDRGARSRTCAHWKACRARSAPRRRAASPRCATRCRCCRCKMPSMPRRWLISSRASAASSICKEDEAARIHRRAEDRRAVDVAALRERRARQGRHPRRRLRGRGRHRQYPDAEGGPAPAQGQEDSRGLRGPRRGLHDQGRLPGAQQAAGGGRRAGVRQSAQFGRRLAAPEGPQHHRVAAAALLRLCLGRDRRQGGADSSPA